MRRFDLRPARGALALLLALGLLAGCAAPAASEPAETPTAAPTPTAKADVFTPVAAEDGEVPTVLPETKDAGRSYLDETLFIGDSNTARYTMYADETGTPFTTLDNNIGVVSMGVGAITTLKCEGFKGDKKLYTLPDAVAMLKPKRIIIGFGTNNLSGSSTDAGKFIDTYKKGLSAIAAAWPYCDIIVNAIPPLDKQRDNTKLTMTQVDAYNEALVAMCAEEGYHFLNTAEVLRDEKTGWAKTDYTLSDGVHLSKIAVTALFEYVRTHAYIAEDRRPQPLGDIPKPDGVPLGLIENDPIAIRGAKVPVEFVAETGGHIEGSTSQMVKKGAKCSAVRAVADSGYKFTGWSASIGSAGNEDSLTFTVPADADANGVIVTARFEAAAHDHDLEELADTRVEPTCSKDGTVKTKCRICGQVFEQTLKATGKHNWGKAYLLTAEKAGTNERLKKLVGKMVHSCQNEGCGYIDLDPDAKPPETTPSPTPTPTPSQKPDTATPSPTPQNTPGGTTGEGSGGSSGGSTAEPTPPPANTPEPTAPPTTAPTAEPTAEPTPEPTEEPTPEPTEEPTPEPTEAPTDPQNETATDGTDGSPPA